jgi:hypothetical protein
MNVEVKRGMVSGYSSQSLIPAFKDHFVTAIESLMRNNESLMMGKVQVSLLNYFRLSQQKSETCFSAISAV